MLFFPLVVEIKFHHPCRKTYKCVTYIHQLYERPANLQGAFIISNIIISFFVFNVFSPLRMNLI